MANLIHVTPFLQVRDLEVTLAFFAGLGFPALYREANYAYLEREGCGFRVLENCETPPGHGGFAYYVDVRDVDALHAELKPALGALPPGHVKGPIDQEYGQRELLIRAPDGNLLVFGQAIR